MLKIKRLDRYLQKVRISKAVKQFPNNFQTIFDIGCGEGVLYNSVKDQVSHYHGCDPGLVGSVKSSKKFIMSLAFPAALEKFPSLQKYDVVTALAVFEHLDEEELAEAGSVISKILSDRGRLVITVPNPIVDYILHVLIWLKMIDGQMTHEHHGFQPKRLQTIFAPYLLQIKHQRFQLGLNNLYVFEKAHSA